MRALFWTILLGVLTQTGSVSAAEPSLDWPYYRSAMQLEAVRAQLGQPASIPWARALNERIGFRVKSAEPEQVEALEQTVALGIARLWTRMKGPPALPKREGRPVIPVGLDTCRKTWDDVEEGMMGLHTAISTWSERPTCLLQRFGTASGLTGDTTESVELSLRMVGGRQGARGRVVGWPGEKEKGFRALYRAEGPILTLLSSQVKIPLGWANVMRSGGGAVLLERPIALNQQGRIGELTARLVYAKPRKNGSKWLDIGTLPAPPLPILVRPYTPKPDDVVSECVGPEGVVAYAREGVERWLGENAIYHCEEGVLVPSDTGRSLVLIQDAGAGRGVTRRAAQVVLYTLAASERIPVEQVEIAENLNRAMTLDHITIFYSDPADEELAARITKSLHLAMPWQAIVTKKTAKLTGKITVQVGW